MLSVGFEPTISAAETLKNYALDRAVTGIGITELYRYQLPRCLRRVSAVARLLEMWVRILPEHGCLSLVSVVCFRVEVCASGRTLVQRSATKSGVSECDREAWIMSGIWPTLGLMCDGK
jgi:hypothetical protein